ncbi:hypothetical protein NCER_101050 [Vairimorpha ceranae BRL01]|uniref:CS domain-containing protein n=2 Tax=Vairimorpha ceranae TaxID=40302 RepID=C4V941_VAIC1|nr:nuclear movement protein [Vairimorpha ceranae]EEQ82264.1 hypothetical protein NCER_101050 [Vairimorpha ceranae BRL01]KKO74189.1 nuclear movement protein [Vairimorpha ceranae]
MSDLYTWKQTLNEVQISFKLDKNSEKTSIAYEIKDRKITINYNGKEILSGVLLKRIDVGSEFWVKEDDNIEFFLTKQRNDWWDSLLEGSEKVDTTKLAEESNLDFSMLDPEAREAIEKMAYESSEKTTNFNN